MALITDYNYKNLKTLLVSKAHTASDPNSTVTGFNFAGLVNLVNALCAEREAAGITCGGHTNLRPTAANQYNLGQFAGIYESLKTFTCACQSEACTCNSRSCTCNTQSACGSQSMSCSCQYNSQNSCSCNVDCSCNVQGGCGSNWGCTCYSENCSDESLCICQGDSGSCLCNYDSGSCSCQYNAPSYCSCNTDCTCNTVCTSNTYTCTTYVAACTALGYTCPCKQYFS